jgi:hypothetical protein
MGVLTVRETFTFAAELQVCRYGPRSPCPGVISSPLCDIHAFKWLLKLVAPWPRTTALPCPLCGPSKVWLFYRMALLACGSGVSNCCAPPPRPPCP